MGSRDRGLLPGTVDLVILQALTAGPMHGFAIARDLRERSDGVLELQDAALYQALHRIEGEGWIESEWGLSENNRRAKFYRMTKSGERALRQEATSFREYAAAVFKVLGQHLPEAKEV